MNPSAPDPRPSAADRAALISSLVDGEAEALRPGCDLWREDAKARSDWHTFHLIGDVLRSEDLATAPARDAAFLSALRSRLAQEPVVLAPHPQAVAERRRGWKLPAAAAAGLVVVSGVLVLTRVSTSTPEASMVAIGGGQAGGNGLALTANGSPDARAPRPLVIEGRLIRDERLDAYLRAHREAGGGFAAAVPGGMPRNIEMVAPAAPAPASVSR